MERYNSSVCVQSPRSGEVRLLQRREGLPKHLVYSPYPNVAEQKMNEQAHIAPQPRRRRRKHISYKNREGITAIDELYEVVQKLYEVLNLKRYHTDIMHAVMFIGEKQKFFFRSLKQNGKRITPLRDFLPSWMDMFVSGAIQMDEDGNERDVDERDEGEAYIPDMPDHVHHDRLQEEIRSALYDMLDEIGKDDLKRGVFDAKYRDVILRKIEEMEEDDKDPEEEEDFIMCQLGRILREGRSNDISLAEVLGSVGQYGCKRNGRRRSDEREGKGHRRFCSVRLDGLAKMWLA